MKFLNYVLLIGSVLFFSACNSLKLSMNAPFTISNASYQNWVGGQPGVSGTNISLEIENEEQVTFSNIYFRNSIVVPRITTQNGQKVLIANINTSKGQPIKELNPDKVNIKQPEKVDMPFQLSSNELVIGYSFKGKKYYFKVDKLKKKSPIFYP